MNPTDLIAYLRTLTVTQGRRSGTQLELFPWQLDFVRGVFRADGSVSEAAITMARAQGKTTLLAGIGAAAIDGPLAIPRGETILVASSFEQGLILFRHIQSFLKLKLAADADLPVKERRFRIWDTAQQARIEDRRTGTTIKVLGSDPRRAHGSAGSLTICDEPAFWPSATGERMIAALRTASGKQTHSLLVALGTRPSSSSHWFEKMLEGGADFALKFAADVGADPFKLSTWKAANPSWDFLPDLQDAIRRDAERAISDPVLLQSFKSLRLNMGVSDVLESELLGADTWRGITGDAPATGPYVLGVDLGQSVSATAVAAYFVETGRLEVVACFGNDPPLRERGIADGVDTLYVRCAERGELLTAGGKSVDHGALIAEAVSRWGNPAVVVADRYKDSDLYDVLNASGLGRCPLEFRGMGWKDGAADVRHFRIACLEGRVTPVESLLMASAMEGARTVSDAAGNQKLSKKNEGGRRVRARDDAAAASILAVSFGDRNRDSVKPRRKRIHFVA